MFLLVALKKCPPNSRRTKFVKYKMRLTRSDSFASLKVSIASLSLILFERCLLLPIIPTSLKEKLQSLYTILGTNLLLYFVSEAVHSISPIQKLLYSSYILYFLHQLSLATVIQIQCETVVQFNANKHKIFPKILILFGHFHFMPPITMSWGLIVLIL